MSYLALDEVNVYLVGVLFVPSLGGWVVALIRAGRFGDPVRCGVPWLHAASAVFLFSLLLKLASTIMLRVYDHTSEAQLYLGEIFGWSLQIATSLMLVAFFELGMDFLRFLDHAPACTAAAAPEDVTTMMPTTMPTTPVSPYAQSLARASLYAVALVLVLLATAIFGTGLCIYVLLYHGDRYSDWKKISNLDVHLLRMDTAYASLHMAVTLVMLFLAIGTVRRCRASTQRIPSILFLGATIAWFVRAFSAFFFSIYWWFPESIQIYKLQYYPTMSTVLYQYPFVVALLLLYVIYSRRQRGLWTTWQPWTVETPYGGPRRSPAQQPTPDTAYYMRAS